MRPSGVVVCRCGSTAVVFTAVPTLCGCTTAKRWRRSATSSSSRSTTEWERSGSSAPATHAFEVPKACCRFSSPSAVVKVTVTQRHPVNGILTLMARLRGRDRVRTDPGKS